MGMFLRIIVLISLASGVIFGQKDTKNEESRLRGSAIASTQIDQWATQSYDVVGVLSYGNNSAGVRYFLDQRWSPDRDEGMFVTPADPYGFYSYKVPELFSAMKYFKPKVGARVYAPLSQDSKRDSKILGLGSTLSFSGAIKFLNYEFGGGHYVNRYRYTTRSVYAGGDYLSDYDNRVFLSLGISIVKNLKLELVDELRLYHYYDDYEKGFFVFQEELSYQFKNLSLSVGHSNLGPTLIDRNTQNNIKFYDRLTSIIYMGLSFEYSFLD